MIARRTQFLSMRFRLVVAVVQALEKRWRFFVFTSDFYQRKARNDLRSVAAPPPSRYIRHAAKSFPFQTKIQTSFIVHQLHFFPSAFSSTFDFEKFTMNPQLALFSFSFTFTFDFHNNCGCFGLCMSRHRTKKFTFQASPRDWCLSSNIQIAAMVPLSATLNRNCLALS